MICTRLAADMGPSSSEAARRTSKEAKRPERHPVRPSGIGQCSGDRRSLQAFRVRGAKRVRDALEEHPPQQVCLSLRTGHLTCDLAIVREPNNTVVVRRLCSLSHETDLLLSDAIRPPMRNRRCFAGIFSGTAFSKLPQTERRSPTGSTSYLLTGRPSVKLQGPSV